MAESDFFQGDGSSAPPPAVLGTNEVSRTTIPLAARMRPRGLDDYVGQSHILGPGQLLRRAISVGYFFWPTRYRENLARADYCGSEPFTF